MLCNRYGIKNVAEFCRTGQAGSNLLYVGESETALLYEIREEDGWFKLFLNKKNGLKFKKAFSERRSAEWFVKRYLTHCCLEQNRVYKTVGSGGLSGGGSMHGRGWNGVPHSGRPPAGTIVVCPECRAKHQVSYNQMISIRPMVLELIPE
ncbi:hypothetical protein GmarT_27320 [Gimesia maris]|uniref:Uncharacterized protein n=1 Tax=Gimesia maris TaxID=122 RepID=A0ABX5YMG3_9PLAN|nr:hypothetical protein GmarT_27320 [Gimesia maris]